LKHNDGHTAEVLQEVMDGLPITKAWCITVIHRQDGGGAMCYWEGKSVESILFHLKETGHAQYEIDLAKPGSLK
jgi:hypothetical protein